MNWTNLINRLKGEPARHADELDDELAFHQEMRERQLVRDGMSADEAYTAARRSMGNTSAMREDAREAWRFRWLDDLGRDLHYGIRTLAGQPGFVAAAFLALTLGIGLNSVFFNIYNALALAPWAIRDPGHTVHLFSLGNDAKARVRGFSWPESRYLNENVTTFAGIASQSVTSLQITRGRESWNASALAVGENFFDVLGTGFVLGRGFSPASGDGHVPNPEIVLHYDAWMARFAGDKGVVGQYVDVNGHLLQIVGVAAAGFSGPVTNIPQAWLPAGWRDILHPGTDSYLNNDSCCARLTGRLKPGVSRAQALAEVNTLAGRFDGQFHVGAHRVLLTDPTLLADPSAKRKIMPEFIPVFLASGLILFLACANVANLQLARAGARRREIAVRLSLGAARSRILRQLLAESLIVSSLAGAASIGISQYAPSAIMHALIPANESVTFTFHNDWRVVAFILAMTFATTTLFGLGPALRTIRDSAASGLRDGGRTTSSGRLRMLLLTVQVMLCAVLVSGAALLTRALDKAQHVDPGFRSQNVIRVRPSFETSGMDAARVELVMGAITAKIAALPGVARVAHTSTTPLGNTFNGTSVQDPRTGASVSSGWIDVSATYFDTVGIPLLNGRAFTAADEGRTDIVAVNDAFARRMWPGENPVGKSIPGLMGGRGRTVSGVYRDTAIQRLSGEPELAIFVPSKGTNISDILVAYQGSADPFLAEIPKLIRDTDSRLLPSVERYEEVVQRARGAAAFAASLANCLGGLALILACVGVYGVASCDVAQRTREIGIRVALGARVQKVVGGVLSRNLKAVLVGVVVGLAGSLGLGKVLHSLLYGVSPADPWALAATIGILAGTAALATWAPARRAARVQPSIALRHE